MMNFLTTQSSPGLNGKRIIRDLITGVETTYDTGTPNSLSHEQAMYAAEHAQNLVIKSLLDDGFATKADLYDVNKLRAAYARQQA